MKSAPLWQPSLQQIAVALQKGLSKNYEHVSVSVEECPDLRDWGCTTEGLSGNACILDVGSEPYAHNKQYRDHQFDILEMATACGLPDAGIFGAGMACPAVLDGHCGEMIASMGLPGDVRSKVARVGRNKECIVEDYGVMIHSGLSNLYLCDGRPGQAVKLEVSIRSGDEASLTQAIRKSMIDNLVANDARQIALGGVFKITGGRVRSHVMPDYNCIGFEYFDEEKKGTKHSETFSNSMKWARTCFASRYCGRATRRDSACTCDPPVNIPISMLSTVSKRRAITTVTLRRRRSRTRAIFTRQQWFFASTIWRVNY